MRFTVGATTALPSKNKQLDNSNFLCTTHIQNSFLSVNKREKNTNSTRPS